MCLNLTECDRRFLPSKPVSDDESALSMLLRRREIAGCELQERGRGGATGGNALHVSIALRPEILASARGYFERGRNN
jgi:hypothetical protein